VQNESDFVLFTTKKEKVECAQRLRRTADLLGFVFLQLVIAEDPG